MYSSTPRHSQHPVQHQHRLTSLRRATPVRHQYRAQARQMLRRRRRKSRPQLSIADNLESDGAQADEGLLTESRARLANVDTGTQWQSAVVSTSRRSLIEDDEGRRHSMLV
jgi:hypothetical protein